MRTALGNRESRSGWNQASDSRRRGIDESAQDLRRKPSAGRCVPRTGLPLCRTNFIALGRRGGPKNGTRRLVMRLRTQKHLEWEESTDTGFCRDRGGDSHKSQIIR